MINAANMVMIAMLGDALPWYYDRGPLETDSEWVGLTSRDQQTKMIVHKDVIRSLKSADLIELDGEQVTLNETSQRVYRTWVTLASRLNLRQFNDERDVIVHGWRKVRDRLNKEDKAE